MLLLSSTTSTQSSRPKPSSAPRPLPLIVHFTFFLPTPAGVKALLVSLCSLFICIFEAEMVWLEWTAPAARSSLPIPSGGCLHRQPLGRNRIAFFPVVAERLWVQDTGCPYRRVWETRPIDLFSTLRSFHWEMATSPAEGAFSYCRTPSRQSALIVSSLNCLYPSLKP